MTRVPSLPCGWTYSDDDPCIWARRIGTDSPLQLTEDLAELVEVPDSQSLGDAEGVAAAAHLAQCHPDDPRLIAVGPVETYAPLAPLVEYIDEYRANRPWWQRLLLS